MYEWLCGDGPTYLCRALVPELLAEWLQVVVGVLGLLGLFVGFRMTRRTLAEMSTQTSILQQQLEFTDRAWLKPSVRVINGVRHKTGRRVETTLEIAVANVGRSTAVDIDAFAEVVPAPMNQSAIKRVADMRLSDLATSTRASHQNRPEELTFSRTIFPDESDTFSWTCQLLMADLVSQQFTGPVEDGSRPSVGLLVVGCVVYRLANTPGKVHLSSFAYHARRIRPNGRGGWTEVIDFPVDELMKNPSTTLIPIPGTFRAD